MSAVDGRPPLTWWLPSLQRFDIRSPVRAWLRRADRLADGAVGYIDGLRAAFPLEGELPAAALTRELLAGDAGTDVWLSADPAWIQPDINGARLLACGRLGLTMDDALALAEALYPTFAEVGMALEVTSPDRWHVRVDADDVPAFAAPEQALGEDLYMHLPQGPQGRRWRALITEVQVVLHQHPLNEQRRERGMPPVNSLWLWGGGVLPPRVRTSFEGVVTDDVLMRALAQRAGVSAMAWKDADVERLQTGWLMDLQGLPWQDIETNWLSRIEASGRRQPVKVHFASGEIWLRKPWHQLRFWRGSAT
ncbi:MULTISPECIES: phosphoglycerate mutase [Dyella]|uniref:Phosphoglycerate mutase n=2 Tax=Dyella TaxID=231454 RepID=A0A4R0YUB1_9GAMM|nr:MULTISPECIES: phosphoglycerate mutase [Dyella]TBR39545.1 phosphoglycerate mutase [Dyella terrae]TCI12872.1 phosphoglycerate mutase [Dyella soli]